MAIKTSAMIRIYRTIFFLCTGFKLGYKIQLRVTVTITCFIIVIRFWPKERQLYD